MTDASVPNAPEVLTAAQPANQREGGGAHPTPALALRRAEWVVQPVSLVTAQALVRRLHYARGGSNTATYCHGLFRRGRDLMDADCLGVAWWLPPTKPAAVATFPERWQGVLSLSRLVVEPGVPKNACSFLIAHSMRLIDRERWPCLVTYADEWQGHTGAIYRASGWRCVGQTRPEATFVLAGRLVARKTGPRTRTRAEMASLGAVLVGRFRKVKYVHLRAGRSDAQAPCVPLGG